MFRSLARWFGGDTANFRAADGSLSIERWRLETPIRLKQSIPSRSGANCSVVGVLIDVRYVVEGRTPVVRAAKVSTDASNVFSRRTGEAWHVPPHRIPPELVAEAVGRELSAKPSKLAAKMLEAWKAAAGTSPA